VSGYAPTWTGREQVAGLKEAAKGRASFQHTFTDKFKATEFMRKVAKTRSPGVIVNVHDVPALLQAAAAEGVRCPNDYSLIAVGDNPLFSVSSPAITALRLRPEEIGCSAAAALLHQLRQEPVPERPPVGADLIERDSVRKIA